MTLAQIINELDLRPLTNMTDPEHIVPTHGYISDLLSCVMTGAGKGSLWVTLQCHINIVAVAALLDLAGVIITEGAEPDQATIDKANEEGILLLSSPKQSYEIVGRLWDLGVRAPD